MRALPLILSLCLAATVHAELACPMHLDAGAKAGLAKDGWILESVIASGQLKNASLFNLDAKHEYELVPDSDRTVGSDLVQQWKASDYRQLDLYMRCDYGKAGKIKIRVPAAMKTCEQKLTGWDPKKGQSAGVRMACR